MSDLYSRPNAAAREMKAVVMFIDVEGFSRIVGKKEPEIIFAELRSCLNRISVIVESHGGQVNKTLGNGLLCYFVANAEVSDPESDRQLMAQVESALRSAISIQHDWVAEFLQNETTGQGQTSKRWHALPLRIGLNAGRVYWGNGSIDLERPEYTVVGETVNLAKRLEGSADVFKVLVSPALKALLDASSAPLDLGLGVVWGRRFLQIKHQTGLFEAWECNPFGSEPELLKAALRLMRTGNKRASQRVPWLCDVPLTAALTSGLTARVIDFSEAGLCLELETPLARKEQFDLTLTTGRSDWNKILNLKGLAHLAFDVRWVEKVGNMHWHGVAFVGFPHEQARALSDLLIQFNNRSHEEI
jgi:class 3 adenylate cyclase